MNTKLLVFLFPAILGVSVFFPSKVDAECTSPSNVGVYCTNTWRYNPATDSRLIPPITPTSPSRSRVTAPSSTRYAAFAWSISAGQGAYSAGNPSIETAESNALELCSEGLDVTDCTSLFWIKDNTYGAVAEGSDSAIGFAWASTARAAAIQAVMNCMNYSSLPQSCTPVGIVHATNGEV